jgi:hypothetical protein
MHGAEPGDRPAGPHFDSIGTFPGGRRMDIGRAFSYIFEDDDWASKLVVTAFVAIIPIVNFALFGWTVALIRQMLDGNDRPLPGWDNFGEKFSDGLIYFVATLIYNIPIILVACVIGGVSMLFGNSNAVAALVAITTCCLVVGVIAYAVVANAVLFIATIRYSRQPSFDVFMQFGENFALAREHLDALIMLVLFGLLAGAIFAMFGWVPCIGWVLALALGTPVWSHLQGQAAVQIVAKRKRGM